MIDSAKACACGCGGFVRSQKGRFLRGHSGRDPQVKVLIAQGKRRGENRVCPVCGREKWVPRYKVEQWKACSQAHFAELQRRHAAWNALQVRCLEWMASNSASRSELARRAGIAESRLDHWFAKEGSALTQKTLDDVASVLEIDTAQALAEAGGKTAEDVWRETGQRIGRVSHSGFKRSSDEIQQMVATKRANGLFESESFKLARIARSVHMRVVKGLTAYLIHQDQPTARELRQFAVRVAAQRGLSVATVTGIWRPYLKRRGLRVQAGRPSMTSTVKTARTTAIADLRASWPRDNRGKLVDGFWSAALAAVKQAEGAKAPTSKESLRQWWIEQGELSA